MANDAVLQVRIDSQLKSEVEQLYRQMGMTFPEAVRLFARQSLLKRRLPFEVNADDDYGPLQTLPNDGSKAEAESAYAMFSSYASNEKRCREEAAWTEAACAKHLAGANAQVVSR